MEILKRNLLFVIFGAVVLGATIGFGVYMTTISGVERGEKRVGAIRQKLEGIIHSNVALSAENVLQSEANSTLSDGKFESLIDKLKGDYEIVDPTDNQDFTVVTVKEHLRQVCTTMENKLRGRDVMMPSDLQHFTFGKFMDATYIPEEEEIGLILKQLDIVHEIVHLLAQSRIHSLSSIGRKDDLRLEKYDLYDFMRYTLTFHGTAQSIQRFMNSLHGARYFFVISTCNIAADPDLVEEIKNIPDPYAPGEDTEEIDGRYRSDGRRRDRRDPTRLAPPGTPQGFQPQSFRPGGHSDRPQPNQRPSRKNVEPKFLSLDERIVFPNPQFLRVIMTVDYFEFHDKTGN